MLRNKRNTAIAVIGLVRVRVNLQIKKVQIHYQVARFMNKKNIIFLHFLLSGLHT